jgi:rubrerythrin
MIYIMKKCPVCGRVHTGDNDALCISCRALKGKL